MYTGLIFQTLWSVQFVTKPTNYSLWLLKVQIGSYSILISDSVNSIQNYRWQISYKNTTPRDHMTSDFPACALLESTVNVALYLLQVKYMCNLYFFNQLTAFHWGVCWRCIVKLYIDDTMMIVVYTI